MNRFIRLLRYILPYKFKVLGSFGLNLLSVLFGLVSISMIVPFLGILFETQELIMENVPLEFNMDSLLHNFNYFISQQIVTNGKAAALLSVSLIVLFFVFLKTGFIYGAKYVTSPIRNGVVRDVRNSIYAKVIKLQLAFFSNERKGDIMARMTGDVQEIEVSVIRSIEIAFKEPITIIAYLSTLFALSPRLTIFVLVALPLTGLIVGRIGKTLRKKSKAAQDKMGFLLSVIEESLSGLRIIKAFNAEDKVNRKFQEENNLYTRIMVKMWRRRDLAVPLSEFLGSAAVVMLMWYGGSLILQKEISIDPEEFIFFIVVFSQIINPAKAITDAYYNIQKGMASAERIDEVLEAEITIKNKENALPLPGFRHHIEYRDVWFKYQDDDVLKNINLKVEKGKTIALVGQSGGGKSTLVDLLPRFYDVVQGSIIIDGHDIRDYNITDLRSNMGIVSQESILFHDTIYNNIAFGVKETTEEEVIAAAKVANAHEFIMESPEGYQTNIGDRGGKLSGGQRQRLSIARAVLANPPILILDEATSALDTESERLVQDALTKLMKNRTSLVIAHRLSTIVNADEIFVLHEGEVVEHGSHSELLKNNGVYKKLQDMQSFG
ncbi:MAG: ABC transporter ATP-binding protein/permease [Bacteroidales bacterium]|nr:ABC transporter ATP-binding protein/permease [Bacteroidales bacterium]MCF8457144.1 ABC transporter ATP-binding protein/permease [Bacteroidales bacterium]